MTKWLIKRVRYYRSGPWRTMKATFYFRALGSGKAADYHHWDCAAKAMQFDHRADAMAFADKHKIREVKFTKIQCEIARTPNSSISTGATS